MGRKPSDREIEAKLERLRQARQADRLRRDDGDGLGRELSEREESHIEAILSEARAEHPEEIMAAEEMIRREREQRAGDGPDPTRTARFSAAAEERSDGLTQGERALFDAFTGGYSSENHRGEDGDDRD